MNQDRKYNLSKSNINNEVRYFIKMTSQIEDDKKIMSPEDLVDAYRKGYDIKKHNFIDDNGDMNMIPLCFDLMICKNPLEKRKEQIFYTFFSQEKTYYQKLLMAEIYQWYLDHYKEKHIDTILQICYSVTHRVDSVWLEIGKDSAVKYISSIKSETSNGIKHTWANYDKIYDICANVIIEVFNGIEPHGNQLDNFFKYETDIKETDVKDVFDNKIKKLRTPDDNGITPLDRIVASIENAISTYLKEDEKDILNNEADDIDYVEAYLNYNDNKKTRILLENFLRICLINHLAVPQLRSLYFVPVPFPNGNQIGHYVYSSSQKTEDTFNNDDKKRIEYIGQLQMLAFTLMFPLAQANISYAQKQRIKDVAVKSAKAAIISRNLSHNLGSHVMAYLKQKLNSVEDILKEDVLKQIDNFLVDCDKDALSKVEMPFLVGLGRFINYLQERQDYVATVATDYIPNRIPFNFKDFIYDELEPDLRYLRHNGDAGEHTMPQNILMDYIAASEGFKSSNITIKYRDFTGKNSLSEGFSELQKIEVALPGGITGRQAVFSIFENIIRNSAKHGKHIANAMTFEIKQLRENELFDTTTFIGYAEFESLSSNNAEPDPLAYNYYKYLNGLPSPAEKLKEWCQKTQYKYLFFTITDYALNSCKSVEELRKSLMKRYINDDNSQNEEAKGLKEMRISAAWLRGASLDTKLMTLPTEGEPGEIPAISARFLPQKDNPDFGHIQYLFALYKPLFALFVLDSNHKTKDGEDIIRKRQKLFDETRITLRRNYDSDVVFSSDFDYADKSYELIIAENESAFDAIKDGAHARVVNFAKGECPTIKTFFDEWAEKGFPGDNDSQKLDKNTFKSLIQKEFYDLFISTTFPTINFKELRDLLLIVDSTADSVHRKDKYKNELSIQSLSDISEDLPNYADRIVFERHFMGTKVIEDSVEDNNKRLKDGIGKSTNLKNDNRILRAKLANYKKALFIEGISGGNATDRLIRKGDWTANWCYKMVLAGLSSIAVFDERMFRYAMQIADTQPAVEDYLIEIPDLDVYFKESDIWDRIRCLKSLPRLIRYFNDLAKLKEIDRYLFMYVLGDYVSNYDYNPGTEVLKIIFPKLKQDEIAVLNKYCKDEVTLQNCFNSATRYFNELKCENENHFESALSGARSQMLLEKRIYIYDLRFSNTLKNSIEIVGYALPSPSKIASSYPAHMGWIKKKNDDFSIEMDSKFDFITFHLGLLDKVYKKFGIKNSKQSIQKQKLTNAIRKQLLFNNSSSHFVIHSGRSKPNGDDMPQKVPFVQYASIEQAIKDCKYTLTELLYSLYYE